MLWTYVSLFTRPSWLGQLFSHETTGTGDQTCEWRSHKGLFKLDLRFLMFFFVSPVLLPWRGSKVLNQSEVNNSSRKPHTSWKRPSWLRHLHVWCPVPVVSWLKSCPSHEGLVKRLTYVQSVNYLSTTASTFLTQLVISWFLILMMHFALYFHEVIPNWINLEAILAAVIVMTVWRYFIVYTSIALRYIHLAVIICYFGVFVKCIIIIITMVFCVDGMNRILVALC